MLSDSCMLLGEVTTVNVTMVNGGVQPNVVPSEFNVTLDCRLAFYVLGSWKPGKAFSLNLNY